MDELVNIFDRSLELGLYFENFIKVLIIYIYHDKIYSEIDYEWQLSKKESWGKDAFKFTPGFDWGGSGNGHQVRYQERLREYLKTLPEEGVKILKNILEIPKEVTKAFSPGHDERKLYNEWDRYLSPFTFVANLNQTATVNKNIELLREGNKKIEEIYRDLEPEFFLELIYAFEKIPDSKAREQELPNGIFEKLIDFMMDNFHKESMNKFSFFANELVHILDNMVPYSNHYKNCLFISDYLYGRAKYLKKGILKKFFNNEWGIKGLLNALEIGDTLSEAGLSLFNFRRGAGESDEMNQDPSYYSVIYDLRLFNLFKKKYISGNINIFAEIDILTDDDFAGFSNETNLPHRRNISRNFLRFFIPYQIGSTHEMGKLSIKPLYKARPIELGGDIHEQMRKYLLDKCFSGDKGSDYFIDFVFSFISPVRSYRGNDDNEVITYELRQNELFSIIEKNYIEAYMTTNEAKINKYLKTKRLSHSTYQVGKTLSITYRECFYIFKNALEKS